LNSIGAVILQLVHAHGVTMQAAGWLEAFKDISIVIGSFVLASFIPKMGYKTSLVIGVSLEAIACASMALLPTFLVARIFFVMIGVAFALIKVSVYSSICLFTTNDTEHASFISILEGWFMLGICSAFIIFGFFADNLHWNYVYWVLFALSILGMVLLFPVRLHGKQVQQEAQKDTVAKSFIQMIALFAKIAVLVFIALAFFYVFIEQGIINWLPTYNNYVLHIPKNMSDYVTALLFVGIVIGRLGGGKLMQYVHWLKVLMFCLVFSIITLLALLYLSALVPKNTPEIISWTQFPLAVYLIFFVGLFIGPIYPTLCSSILSSFSAKFHSAMAAIIVIFSAFGGVVGARVIAIFFDRFGGLAAFKVPILPLIILIIFLLPYYYLLQKQKTASKSS
jgi:fucose permease